MAEPNAWASLGLSPVTAPATSTTPTRTLGAADYQRIAAEEGLPPQWLQTFMGQETSGGKNIRDSVQGARGALQITEPRFRDAGGRDFNDPEDVARTSVRELKRMVERYNGNPRAVAASWHSHPSNVNPDGTLKNPGAKDALGKTTASYQDDIAGAMGGAKPAGDAWASLGLMPVGSGAGDAGGGRTGLNYAPDTPKGDGKSTGILDAAGRGIAHGVIGLAESVNLAGQFLAGRVGAQGVQEFFKHGAEWWAQTGKGYEMPAELQGNIIDNPALLGKGAWWAYNVADMVPSVASTMIPALGAYGAMVKGPAAIARLARVGAAVTGGTIGGAQEGLQTYKTVLERGGSDSEAAVAGTLMGLASAGLNAISLNVFMGKSTAPLKKFLLSGATESLTEWAEEPAEGAILSNTSVAKPEDDPMSRLREGINVVPPSFLLGGVGGLGGTRQSAPAGGTEQPAAGQQPQPGLGVNGVQPAPAATPAGTPPPVPPAAPAGGAGSNLPASVLVTGIPKTPVPAPTEPVDLTDVSDVPGMEPGVFPTGEPAQPVGGFGVNPTTPAAEPVGGIEAIQPPIPAPPIPEALPAAPVAESQAPAPSEPGDTGVAPGQVSAVEPVQPDIGNPISPPADVQTTSQPVQSSPNPEPAPSVTRPVDKRRQRAEDAKKLNTDRDDLLTAVAKLGGIDWNQAHSEWGLDPADWKKAPRPVFGMPVFRAKNGRLLDDMAEALHEAGYIAEATPNALFDALDRHIGGQPVYTASGYEAVARRMSEERAAADEMEAQSQEIDEAMVDAAERMTGQLDPEDEALESLTATALLDVYRGRLGDAIIEDIFERAALETADGTEAEFDASVRRLIEEYTHDDGQADSEAAEYPGGESAQGEGGEAGGRVEGDAASSAGEAAAEPDQPASEPEEAPEVAPPPEPAPKPEAAPEPAPAPAGVVASGGGLFALTGQTEGEAQAEAAMRDREAKAKRQRESAPPPESFVLAGSSRPADEAAAQGAQDIPGLLDAEPETPKGPDIEKGRAFLREMLVDVDAVDEESGETVKAKLSALEVLEDSAEQITKTKGLLECLSS